GACATAGAAGGRFARLARRRLARFPRSPHRGFGELETAIAEALSQLRQGLRHDRREDVAAIDAGIALLGIGRELIRVRDSDAPTQADVAVADEVVRFLATGRSRPLERARRAASEGAAGCLATLRDDRLGVEDARA